MPSKHELLDLLNKYNRQQIANLFEVSIRTIGRWLKAYGLTYESYKHRHCLSLDLSDLIYGCLLGKGKILDKRFLLTQSAVKEDYIAWIAKELQLLSASYYLKNKCCRLSTKSHKVFKDLRALWYKNNHKFIPECLTLNELMFTHWFLQNGTNIQNKRTIRLAAHFLNADLLIELLKDDLNIVCRIQKPFVYIESHHYDLALDIIRNNVFLDCFKQKLSKVDITSNRLKAKVKEIRNLYKQKMPIKEIAKIYNTSIQSVYNIINNVTYKEKLHQLVDVKVVYNPH